MKLVSARSCPEMHASESSVAICLLFASFVATHPARVVQRMDASRKCCVPGYAFNEDLECVHVEPDKLNYTTHDALQTIESQHPSRQIVTMIASVQGLSCSHDDAGTTRPRHYPPIHATLSIPGEYCIENMINGTVVVVKCPDTDSQMILDKENLSGTTVMMKTTATIITVTTITTITTINVANVSSNTSKEDKKETVYHGSDLRTVYFWGAQTYMDTNVAHVVLCIIVVVVYLSVPELGKNIYNRAVLRHNFCLLVQGCMLQFLGYCHLCDCPMNDNFAVLLWILQQYFTNATVFWLNVICFDMTLSITRFRWIVGSNNVNQEENRRFLLYSVFAWGGALIPAIVAFILEFCPGISEDLPFKPNYRRYLNGPNYIVNIYFFGIPLITLFLNNVLFIFTTYKIIMIQRSTEIATRNHTNVLRKKYFLFLQMYLLMGAPWFFGLLFACLNKLVVLKICRMIWPILWLLMLATDKKLRQKLTSKLRCIRKKQEATTTSS
ncbi:G-protein coupled receptor Mth2-like [Linepithema humile]|uniref:G-protein coupled receptor Mth2-like n=1 Tax=Linepithema humile TaxID=83485 RepID=UPI0006234D8F|nr:PREDICTED: G-protein coupled receptor Mth2-like [Linepithema humile]